jgi:glycerate 2-kinase
MCFNDNVKSAGRTNLLGLWKSCLDEVSPGRLLARSDAGRDAGTARLFWGKAARASWQARRSGCPSLVLSPEPRPDSVPSWQKGPLTWVQGEHPLPGPGSFAAGQAILEFFDALRRGGIQKLEVDLSGGASSLAWLKPHGITDASLQHRLGELYRRRQTIETLNRERSRLCLLKAGGTARILRQIAPQVRVRVRLISDVAPFGAQVVGSGPFWDGLTPHRVLADNRRLCRSLMAAATDRGAVVRLLRQAWIAPWKHWVEVASRSALATRDPDCESWILLGGEPLLELPRAASHRKGGRQSQIALALAQELEPEIRRGRLELLCAASDGRDGNSGSAGSWITSETLPGGRFPQEAARALRSFASAELLASSGALLPESQPFTNVQDALIVRIKASSS